MRSQSLPGRDRQQIKKEGDYQSEDFLVTLFFVICPLAEALAALPRQTLRPHWTAKPAEEKDCGLKV